jgi:hypothetical protein
MSDTPTRTYRLRKKTETEIFGPMELNDLKNLADTAYIAPDDEVADDGDNWKAAPEFEELEMVWTVLMTDGLTYGPTTVGTLREFYRAGELAKNLDITHAKSGEKSTVETLLGSDFISELEAAQKAVPAEVDDIELEQSLEVARDLRIQQLEADLEKVKKDYDMLMHQYRRVSEELLTFKKKT